MDFRLESGEIKAKRLLADLDAFVDYHTKARGARPDHLLLFRKDYTRLHEQAVKALKRNWKGSLDADDVTLSFHDIPVRCEGDD